MYYVDIRVGEPEIFLAYVPYFEKKNKMRLMRSPCCVSVWRPPSQRLKAGLMEPEDKAGGRQWLGKQVIAANNTHATIEELLDEVFSMRPVADQTFST
jgi:hypothetical protein